MAALVQSRLSQSDRHLWSHGVLLTCQRKKILVHSTIEKYLAIASSLEATIS